MIILVQQLTPLIWSHSGSCSALIHCTCAVWYLEKVTVALTPDSQKLQCSLFGTYDSCKLATKIVILKIHWLAVEAGQVYPT